MAAVGKYVFSVAVASLICGVLCGMIKDSANQKIIKLVCGVFLTLTVIRPAANCSLEELSSFALPYRAGASDASRAGEEFARESLRQIIKAETEAYILDKAKQMDAVISVQVSVSQDPVPVPVSVQIGGTLSPACRQKLQQIITEDLNIAKENQQWIG